MVSTSYSVNFAVVLKFGTRDLAKSYTFSAIYKIIDWQLLYCMELII
jgi:hypothetical protein